MKAAIGNTLLLGIIVTFMSTVLLVVVSSIVYTKAYRIKNRIIDEIEKIETFDDSVTATLTTLFGEIGYKTNPNMNNSVCDKYARKIADTRHPEVVNKTSAYSYCVIKVDADSSRGGYYYKVVSFAYLDLPLVSAIQVPVYGETRIFYNS